MTKTNDLLQQLESKMTPEALTLIASYKDAGEELKCFMVPMILTEGVEYAVRYIKTEKTNRQRFAPLILEYLSAHRAGDDKVTCEKAFALMDLAESIWEADA